MNKLLNITRFIFNAKLTNYILKITNRIYLKGNFKTWNEALEISEDNYFSKKIFKKIKINFIKSLKSSHTFERDGVILSKKKNNEDNIIKYYKFFFKKNRNICRILDIGGGTGSIYFKNIDFIRTKKNLSWLVYEQKKLVSFLKKNIKIEQINFTSNLSNKYVNKFKIILMQSSLQYFSNPYNLLKRLCSLRPNFILIDETPFTSKTFDQIKIQVVPKKIYSTEYPLYIFSQKKMITFLKKKNYTLLDKKNCPQGIGGYNYKCLLFKKD